MKLLANIFRAFHSMKKSNLNFLKEYKFLTILYRVRPHEPVHLRFLTSVYINGKLISKGVGQNKR